MGKVSQWKSLNSILFLHNLNRTANLKHTIINVIVKMENVTKYENIALVIIL